MAYRNSRNVDLHARIDEIVRQGDATIVDERTLPSRAKMVDQIVSNHLAGTPLLHGLKIYRGTKDPDVDAGSFEGASKHGTIHFDLARGYAETANANIGIRFDNTWGIGMLAEYAMPDDAVFHRNFGLEDQASGKSSDGGMTVARTELLLQPLVEAIVNARDDAGREQARVELVSFCDRSLYEIAIPAAQQPLRQWVVDLDAEGIRSRLLESQDHGALADVMIDVVRERKHAIDEYMAMPLSDDLKRFTDAEQFSSGLSTLLPAVAKRIDNMLYEIRSETFSVNHESLSAAIRWRRTAQEGMQLARLTNSGTHVHYDDPRLHRIQELRDATHAIGSAVYYESKRALFDDAATLITTGKSLAAERNALIERQQAAAASVSRTAASLDKGNRIRSNVVARLDALHAEERSARSRNILTRLWFQFTRSKELNMERAQFNSRLAKVDGRLEEIHAYRGKIRAASEGLREKSELLDGQTRDVERKLDGMARDGYISFVSEARRRGLLGPTDADWDALNRCMETELAQREAAFAAGRKAVSVMQEVSEKGLSVAVAETVTNPALPAPPESRRIGDEELLRALIDSGENPTAEYIAELSALLETAQAQASGRLVTAAEAVAALATKSASAVSERDVLAAGDQTAQPVRSGKVSGPREIEYTL
jgi:hypothetical protein